MARRKQGKGVQMEKRQIWKPRQTRSGVLSIRGMGPDLWKTAPGLCLSFCSPRQLHMNSELEDKHREAVLERGSKMCPKVASPVFE